MGHIFISYSHKDKEYVHKLAESLQAEGFEVWIDDRIDYGTRWPLVIETAIDSCEIFVLVAGRNSHDSEWVQHEFARAQRLHKPIFPLLLNGAPWLSFESIQYYDIRDLRMPNRKFYDDLRKQTNNYIKAIKEMIIGSWPIYINKQYGFSVNYPLDGTIEFENSILVQIRFPRLEGTNLRNKYITVHFNDDGILRSPLRHGESPFKSMNVEILGQGFLLESDSDGAAGTFGEWTSYSISRGNKIITLSLTLITTSHQAYLPQLLPRIDLNAEKENFVYVISTFSWID
jgi:hypothetical protein